MVRDDKLPFRCNERIRVPQVRVIDENGQQLGIMPTRQALQIAREKGLDLIEVAPNASPPVCRIVDYGKFLYQLRKREKEARKHQKGLKEIRIRPQTDKHDLEFKARNATEALQEGHKVRLCMILRGREMAHMDMAYSKLNEIMGMLSHIAQVEGEPKLQGSQIVVMLAPKREALKARHSGHA
ncbi:MAG: translation initiation factor IF-3 [Armatimonadetes bacterium]|nr:translation initiation factor IF-3 [Armatimonadota bacterium]MCX7776549.1 translation initiation factor IF-3 [Armatimonadota bacterium]